MLKNQREESNESSKSSTTVFTVDDELTDICNNGDAGNETGKVKKVKKYREREQWSNKFEFILSCMAFSIGLGNVWRFPYLCFKNGGGAFLIPYFICLIGGGIPVYFLEVAIGQYWQSGGISVWERIAPISKGVGYGTAVVCFILNIYYIIILSWALLYLYYSFSTVLPWSTCGNDWNSDYCWSEDSVGELIKNDTSHKYKRIDSVVEFWERKILQESAGVDHVDGLQWQLVLTLFIMWVVCFLCICRGIKSTGKAVYFTAIFPYLMMTILFIRGITLDGAMKGIQFYLKPDFNRLYESQVWIDAGTQIFFSYALALGTMTALGSYNSFHNNFYLQLFFVCGMNSGTSFFAGFAIFSVLGFMATEQNLSVANVTEGGPGLAFVAYPKGVAQMPAATVWAILFFIMILLLGLGSQFVAVEGFITAVVDIFPEYLRVGHRRERFIGIVCFISFLFGLPMVTRGGIYVFQLFDYYGASGMCLLWMCFFECITLAWIYGAEKFLANIKEMLGYRINLWFVICWKYLSPLLVAFIFWFSIIKYKPVKYKEYVYPDWAIGLGVSLALSSMLVVPAYLIYAFAMAKGTFVDRLNALLTPSPSPHYEKQQQIKDTRNGCSKNSDNNIA